MEEIDIEIKKHRDNIKKIIDKLKQTGGTKQMQIYNS